MDKKQCQKCLAELTGKPKIDVEGKIYCYRCAKDIVAFIEEEKDKTNLSEYYKKKTEYDKENKKHDDWQAKKYKYKTSVGWQINNLELLLLIFIGGAAGLTISRFFCFVGIIVGIVLWFKLYEFVDKRREAAFIGIYPEPESSLLEPKHPEPIKIKHHPLPPDGTDIKFKYREDILNRDQYTCQLCGKRESKNNLEVHHIIPRANLVLDDPCNLITLCKFCHDREDWYDHVRIYPTTIYPIKANKFSGKKVKDYQAGQRVKIAPTEKVLEERKGLNKDQIAYLVEQLMAETTKKSK